MNIDHEFIRISHTKDNDGPTLKFGDVVKLTSRKRSRLFVMCDDKSKDIHCYGKCDLGRSECLHYNFLCWYYGYLKSVERDLEDL